MQRIRSLLHARERGATAVFVALLSLALMAAGAVSVDVANMWSDRRQLQNGADAGALAIAQACAKNKPGCSTDPATATGFAEANKNDGVASAVVQSLSLTAGEVTVGTEDATEHWFAPIVGLQASTDITASATASWEVTSGGTSSLPLTFSICEIVELANAAGTDFVFNSASGKYELVQESTVQSVIYLAHPGSSSAKENPCNPSPSGAVVPGGFSWIDADSGACSATTSIGQVVGSDPGNPGPAACTEAHLQSLIGKVILLPIFGQSSGSGNNATYTIYGYVGFKLSGYLLQSAGGPKSYNSSGCNAGNGQCIKGTFSFITDGTGQTDPNAPNLGASTVRLTK